MITGKIIQADAINGIVTAPNFVLNSSALLNTSGWTEGSYAAGTRPSGTFTASSGAGAFAVSRTTTSPLGDTGTSLVFTKSAGSQQGRAIQTEFALPLEYRAKVLKIKNAYINTSTNATDFVAGSNTTDSDMIFYVAYSTDNGSTYTVAEPSSFKLLSNSKDISDYLESSYQTPYNATHMRLIAYVASTSTTAWSIKTTVSVSPSTYVYGTPITYLGAITMTASGLGTGAATVTAYGWKNGDRLQVRGKVLKDGSGGSGSSSVTLSLPYTIDTAKLDDTGFSPFGEGILGNTASNSNMDVIYATSTSIRFYQNDATTFIGSEFTANNVIAFDFEVPILGWSSSTQQSDEYEGRVIAARFTGSNETANTTYTTLSLTSTVLDTVGGKSGNTYIVKSSGNYDIEATATGYGTGSVGAYYVMRITVDGVTKADFSNVYDAANSISRPMVASLKSYPLKAGQVILVESLYGGSIATPNITLQSFTISKHSGSPTISATETISANYTGAPPTGTLNGSFNIVTFGTKVKDSHGAYSSGSYTVPTSGQFDISSQVTISSTFSANQSIGIGIYVDGVQKYANFERVDVASTTSYTASINVKAIPLLSGQVITIRAYGDGTSPSYSSSGPLNFFSIVRSGSY